MTLQEAWEEWIKPNIGTDCGPEHEGWKSDELNEAIRVMDRHMHEIKRTRTSPPAPNPFATIKPGPA